jgi:hypothetical protein
MRPHNRVASCAGVPRDGSVLAACMYARSGEAHADTWRRAGSPLLVVSAPRAYTGPRLAGNRPIRGQRRRQKQFPPQTPQLQSPLQHSDWSPQLEPSSEHSPSPPLPLSDEPFSLDASVSSDVGGVVPNETHFLTRGPQANLVRRGSRFFARLTYYAMRSTPQEA